MYFMI